MQDPVRGEGRAPPGLKRTSSLRGVACLGLAALLALPSVVGARSFQAGALFEDPRSLLTNYSSTTSLFVAGGTGEMSGWRLGHPGASFGMGVRYHERNGFITGTTMALIQIFAGAMASSAPKSSETWTEGNYRYTRTTYRSEAERQAIMASASSSAAQMFSSPNQSFDLELYSRNVGGDVSGYRATMMVGGFGVGTDSMVDLGFGFGSTTAAVAEDGRYLITHWSYFGIPVRLSVPMGPLLLWAQFDWNWFGHTREARDDRDKAVFAPGSTTELKTAGFPVRLGVSAALLQRVYVEAVALTPSLTSLEFGFTAAAGARF